MNMKKRVLIFLMALAMLATLAACGGGGKSPAGTYKLTQINSGGEEMSVKDLADLFGMEIDMTLELKDDKSFTWDMGLWGEGESASGTWKMDGDSLVLSAEGEDLPVTYDGKTIATTTRRAGDSWCAPVRLRLPEDIKFRWSTCAGTPPSTARRTASISTWWCSPPIPRRATSPGRVSSR